MFVIENNIKRLRQEKELTQEQFAEAIQVSRQTVVAIEKGGYEPSLRLAYTIARFFNVPIEKVFIFKGE
ncbi:MAG: helix-turn-helix transcriptional regulator [Candidatus Izemoplasmataceae bacterium]|jgi:putative transcriptional regulator|uniref:helix-turn-helix transcriptional regulator n=1 Tax=Liberiplasma polymorphum TaxID=3374570 RepID=UPI003774E0A8